LGENHIGINLREFTNLDKFMFGSNIPLYDAAVRIRDPVRHVARKHKYMSKVKG